MAHRLVTLLLVLAVIGVGGSEDSDSETSTSSTSPLLETSTVQDIEPMVADAMNQVFKMGLPVFTQFGSDPDVSGECSAALVKTMLALRRMEPWAIRSECITYRFWKNGSERVE